MWHCIVPTVDIKQKLRNELMIMVFLLQEMFTLNIFTHLLLQPVLQNYSPRSKRKTENSKNFINAKNKLLSLVAAALCSTIKEKNLKMDKIRSDVKCSAMNSIGQ